MADAPKSPKGTEMSRREGQQLARSGHPLFDLRSELDTLFDRFFSTSLFTPFGTRFMEAQPLRQQFGGALPKVDISENDREIQIVAELPGLKQEDVDLNLQDDVLTVSGETRESREEKEKQYHLTERSYGRFERSFRLPDAVDPDNISANFENGLLTITLPKSEKSRQKAKRIEIGRK